MSLFGMRRRSPDEDAERLDLEPGGQRLMRRRSPDEDAARLDLEPGSQRLKARREGREAAPRGGAGSRRGRARGASVGVVSDALSSSLRLLRIAVAEDRGLREALAALEADVGKALVAEDYASIRDRLAELRIAPTGPGGGPDFALELFHRVVFGAQPIAQGFELRGPSADLAELLRVSHLESAEDHALRRLLRVFETLARHATRTREAGALMKRCVGELIENLAELARGEVDHRARLTEIRERLGAAEELRDLEEVRSLLVAQVEALVTEASARESSMRDALERARDSRRQAAELEAALTDAQGEARTDALTGLGNRRALAESLERAAERASPTAVLALDLDHFKQVNDRWGHAAGDAALRFVADLLRGELRGDDEAFRVGGEELLVLLPGASWQGARATAERLRARLAASTVPVAPSVVIGLTMSVGVSVRTPGAAFDDVLAEADAALYRAKEGGRNRVVG
jgi:diguanylate cyclase (GGDEF)-like protein